MNFKVVFHLLSFLLLILSGVKVLVTGVSWLMNDPSHVWLGMLESAGISLLAGLVMTRLRSSGSIQTWLRRAGGTILVGLGIELAMRRG